MLLNYLRQLWYCVPLLMLILLFCVGYAYHVNARRATDDPDRRDFHFGAIFLTLFGPVLLLLYVGFWLLRAIVAAISLILVTIGLVIVRKPFLVTWIKKIFAKIGNMLLELNTALIYAFLGRGSKKPPF